MHKLWYLMALTIALPAWSADQDGDGYQDEASGGDDCDDNAPHTFPGHPELCDATDNDCDGNIDQGITTKQYFIDVDGDGFGDPNPTFALSFDCPPAGYSPYPTDCDDLDPNIHPLITTPHDVPPPLDPHRVEYTEADRDPSFVVDGVDQDCDLVDLCYADLDGDGHGNPSQIVPDNDLDCTNNSAPTAATGDDCDDNTASVSPGTAEICNGIDDNCDGTVDDGCDTGAPSAPRAASTPSAPSCNASPGGAGLLWLLLPSSALTFRRRRV